MSEGWARVAIGKTMARDGTPMTMKLHSTVELYLRDEATAKAWVGDDPRQSAAV